MRRFFAQALVIARRDFSAIVLTPTFLIFLLAPLFMLTIATIGIDTPMIGMKRASIPGSMYFSFSRRRAPGHRRA